MHTSFLVVLGGQRGKHRNIHHGKLAIKLLFCPFKRFRLPHDRLFSADGSICPLSSICLRLPPIYNRVFLANLCPCLSTQQSFSFWRCATAWFQLNSAIKLTVIFFVSCWTHSTFWKKQLTSVYRIVRTEYIVWLRSQSVSIWLINHVCVRESFGIFRLIENIFLSIFS